MNFLPTDTLAGYARTAVDLRARMIDYNGSSIAMTYLEALFEGMPAEYGTMTPDLLTAIHNVTGSPWRIGEPYIVAPAMTAIIAAAAEALDLSGEVLPEDIAPDDQGVVFFPEPLYHRGHTGKVSSIGAITWARVTSTTGRSSWMVAGWADQHDQHDPSVARRRADLAHRPDLARQLGPYLLSDYTEIPIGRAVERPERPVVDDAEHDWEPTPDGRYCIDEATARTRGCTAIAYAFWCIQAQPLAAVAAAPMDRPARGRAARANIKHDTRVVMLRRTSPLTEPGDGEPKWHYRVRFVVRPLAAPDRPWRQPLPHLDQRPHQGPRRRPPAARRESRRPRPLNAPSRHPHSRPRGPVVAAAMPRQPAAPPQSHATIKGEGQP